MVDNNALQQAIELYDRFTHEGMDRRDFFGRMTVIAGCAAAATSLIAAIAASPAAAAIIPATDKRLVTRKGELVAGNPLKGYVAVRKGAKRPPIVVVIHENRGLNAHIEDVTRRMALEGFMAVAPDMLSPVGGTPANEDAARDAIGKLDLGQSVAQAVDLIAKLKKDRKTNGKAGIVGFCWGGAFVDRVAVEAGSGLDAGVSYYGPAPAPSEAAKVQAPLMIHLAGLDKRVAETAFPWIAALRQAGKSVAYHGYDGVNHAFNNDTSAERYDKPAADLAWGRTVRFFKRYLTR
jgi:carboxymethylenebutenolidase